MLVTFTRTGSRRYRISVEGPSIDPLWMEPAPGFDELLPHDMAHFVVENHLGLTGGVFGQLASGGTANTFHPADSTGKRKAVRRGKQISAANREDAVLSEKAVAEAWAKWKGAKRVSSGETVLSEAEIDAICSAFDSVSSRWSRLGVGDSMRLEWQGERVKGPRRQNR